jgi:hypothetical protein
MRWLIIYDDRFKKQEIIEAEDFYELHTKVDSDKVIAVVRLQPKEQDEGE